MLTKSFWNFTFLHYITFRKNTGCYSRFIRWVSDYLVLKESSAEALMSLLWRDTPVPVGSSGAEDLASTHLTSSLIHPPVIAPTLQLDTVGSSGATGSSPRGLSQVQQIAPTPMRRFIRCQPDRPVLLHRIIRCHWFLQNSSISTIFWVLSACFALFGLFASSLGSINIQLINSLVPLIALLLNLQNHKTMA